MNNRQLSRLKLIGIFFAFVGPLLIASVLYFGQNWFEFDATARGYLLPAGQILNSADVRLIKTDGTREHSNSPLLDGRWLLLFNGTADCDLYCQANLFKMRQAKQVIGRDSARVRTVYLLSDASLGAELRDLLVQYPTFSVYEVADFAQRGTQIPELKQNHVYIVDPMGNLVLRYPPHADSRDIISDIKRLLKVSKIG